jgi:ATP-dependent DNA helicase RecQ
MEYLERALDDPTAAPCGRCANERGSGLPTGVRADLAQDAIRFLRRDARPIAPRKQWPVTSESGAARRITPPNEPGVALCVYGDAGWGRAIADGKVGAGPFDDELVGAAEALVRDRWRPSPAPTWVAFVPSASAPTFVADFAARLAARLGLPLVDCLTARVGLPPQKEMLNSVLQHRNATRKLGIDADLVRPGPVLLIDDIVESGWTLTVAGALLHEHGAGPVHPFALAVASARGA